jgi:type IV pilus assembly protein PilB
VKQDLGKLLLENEQITSEQLNQAAQEAAQTREPVSTVLLRLGLVNEDIINTVLELHYAVNYLNLKKIDPNPDLVSLLPWELVLQHELAPVSKEDNRLTIAMVNPSDTEALAKAKEHLPGLQIRTVVCSDDGFQDFVVRLIPQVQAFEEQTEQVEAPVETPIASPQSTAIAEFEITPLEDESVNTADGDNAVVRLCNHILSNAIVRGCTNIHIEPAERQILVHYRKEGVLFAARKLPRAILSELIVRFKNMSSAGNKEQGLPYDGRLSVRHGGQTFFFRLSIVPGAYGEHLVIWLE